MVAYRLDWPHDQDVNSNSTVQSGSKFYVYENTTTTLKTLYSDRAGLVTRANPVVADAAGRFDIAYVAATDLVTLTWKTSADVLIDSWDDQEPEVSTDLTQLTAYVARVGGNSNRMTGPLELKEGTAITSANSIDLDAMTGNWAHVTGTTGTATMTLAQGSTRTLIYDDVVALTHSANLLLGGVSFSTHAGMALVFYGEGSGVTRLIGGMTASGKSIVESVAVTIGIGDQTTAIAAGTNKRRWRAPFAFTVTAIRASLATAQASGASLVTIDVNNAGNSMMTTVITIDNNEVTSTTAATPNVLNSTYVSIADDALIAVDFDNCDGSTTAAGADVTLIGYKFNLS